MIKKIYENLKKFINENIKELIFLFGFYVVMTYPLPYFVLVSGGTIDVSDRVVVEDAYEQKGSFNLAYVNELKGTLPTVLLSHVIPSWTLYEEADYSYDETEDLYDIAKRNNIYLRQSLQNSIKVAYEEAGNEFKIKNTAYLIYYVYDYVKEYSDIRVGDQLIEYDGHKILDIDDYKAYVQKQETGDFIKIKVLRNGHEVETKLKVLEEKEKYTGIIVSTIYDYETNPKISFKFKENESGSSGGLTLALAIYNKLTKEDITKGYKIVGTGTIEPDGSVGAIGGVEYKLKGAVKSKADIFIVPSGDNYKEALALKKKEKYDIYIMEVSTFKEALKKLKDYEK